MTAHMSADRRQFWLVAEVLLLLVSLAAAVLLQRLFVDGSYLTPLVFTTVVAHASLIAMRWFGFGVTTSAAISLIGVALAIVATHYADTAIALLIPSGDTLTALQADLADAQFVFQDQQAPVPVATGFVVVASMAFWLFAFVSDWAAFRLFAPGQALLPPLCVLIFVSLLGVADNRTTTTAMLVVAAVLFVLAHRAAQRASEGLWLGNGPMPAYLALLGAGALVAVVAAFAGVLGGPSVPGADAAPLVEIGEDGRQEANPIEVTSPLVTIQSRLVDQSDDVLFTVETTQESYWRIAALDIFDGNLWRSQGQFQTGDDSLDVAYPPNVPVNEVSSTFDLGNLNVVWAPAAYLPVGIETAGETDINYEAESATFIVDTGERAVSNGLVYTVAAQIPNFTPAVLRNLEATSGDTIDSRYTDLPADYSPLARQLAEELTAPHAATYDKALALQNYFRTNFTYDLEVDKGHDIRRLEDFLTVQRGYCEQFAGTFASMARAVGIPARVATGFTPGEADPANPGVLQVRGRHAHAWPEVWIAGAGWVAFEPTPGRGAPNASQYTGVPEAQDTGTPAQPDAAEEQPAPADETQAAQGAEATPTPVPPAPETAVPVQAEEVQAAEATELDEGTSFPFWLGAVLGAALIWIFGIPALKRLVASRRRDQVGDDTRRTITTAWSELVDHFEVLGHAPNESETLTEYSERISRLLPNTTSGFTELTELTVGAAYDAEPPSPEHTQHALELAAGIRKAIDEDEAWLVRSARDIDPRPLLRFSDPIALRAERLALGATTVIERPEGDNGGPIDLLLEDPPA